MFINNFYMFLYLEFTFSFSEGIEFEESHDHKQIPVKIKWFHTQWFITNAVIY